MHPCPASSAVPYLVLPGSVQPAPDSGWTDLTAGGIEEGWRQLGGAVEYTIERLQLEIRLTEGANSGIKYLMTEDDDSSPGSAAAFENQLPDNMRHPEADSGRDGNRARASLHDLLPAIGQWRFLKGPGFFSHARIVVRADGRVEHWLDDLPVLEYDCNSSELDEAVARSRFAAHDRLGKWPEGRILLEDQGDEVAFRSIRIRPLDRAE